MLNFFTDPYPNELLYSAIGRYHHMLENDIIETNFDIYGLKKPVPVIYYSYQTNKFVENLGGIYTENEIIYSHTIYPFFKPFLTEDAQKECEDGMLYGNTNYIRRRLYNKIFSSKNLRYCPCCIEEDLIKYGEAYFHVYHQLDGIMVCYKHNVMLYNYDNQNVWSNINDYVILNEQNTKTNIIYNKNIFLYNISKLSSELFESDTTSRITKDKLRRYYRNILSGKGYISYGGIVKMQSLIKDIIDFYGIENLQSFESGLDINKRDNWVKHILSDTNRFVHPIRHLLLIRFLNKSMDSVAENIDYEYCVFSSEAFICINKYCNNSENTNVTLLKLYTTNSTKETIGIFKCNTCGMIVKKLLCKFTNKVVIKEILDYGHVWYTILKSFHERKITIKEIAYEMGEKYTVIQYHLNKLHIDVPSKSNNIDKLDKYKEILKRLITTELNITRSEIREKYSKEYAFVYRNDIGWFNENMPKSKINRTIDVDKQQMYRNELMSLMSLNKYISRNEIQQIMRYRFSYLLNNDKIWLEQNAPKIKPRKEFKRCLDWESRDRELLCYIRSKYSEIINKNTAVKITITLLNREIEGYPINPYTLERTPKSKEFINTILDTTESYRFRCYKRFIDNYYEKNKNITIDDVVKEFSTLKKTDIKIINNLTEYIRQKYLCD